MAEKINLPKEKIIDLYSNKKVSTTKLAETYKCHQSTIWRLLKKNKVKMIKAKGFNKNKNYSKKTQFKKGCDPWCKGKKNPKITGKNHYNWKGGKTPLNKTLRCHSMWKIWREAVFLRDNFTCQNKNCKYCKNKIGGMLHPHHIKPLARYPELAFIVDNGITYCAKFHLKSGIHKGIMNSLSQEEVN